MKEDQNSGSTTGNFSGIRVIDVTHTLAGPYCSKLMADMGAEVIKVEPPVTGERSRAHPHNKNGTSGFFMFRNAGKKSLCLDLKKPKAIELFSDLARVSDVVVQNMSVGVMERLGLGYEDLRKVNPRIIMCSISGYGRTGPLSSWPGGDSTIEAMSGAMAIGGHADGPPLPSWVPWVDFATGTHALGAVGAALYYRSVTGTGQQIDVSMLDCAVSYHDFAVEEYLMSDGKVHRTRTGPMHPTLALLGVYECKDGYLLVSGSRNWEQFTKLIGRPDLATDPRFDTSAHRNENKEEVNRLLSEWIKNYDMSEALSRLGQVGMRAVRPLSIEEVVNHPQIAAREMLVQVDDPLAGRVKVISTPFKFSETLARVRGRAPLIGEHNEAILSGILGYSQARIVELRDEKVLYAEPAVQALADN